MSDDLNTEIKISANATGVETGVTQAKRSLASLSQAANQVGEQGGKGIEKLGTASTAAGAKVEQVTKNMVASLQRQTAALEAGGTATRQYQESLARLRGANLDALRPYLDQLDAARTKAEAATRAQNGFVDRLGTLGSVSAIARGQLAALTASFTVGSVFAFVKGINDGIDALNDIKDATGATIENISALEDVATRTGASLELVGSVLVKFNDVLSKATPGSDMALALKSIGLEAAELRKLDPAEALRRTAVALSGYADDANKARLIQELFGKSVKEAAPFLTDLAEKGALVGKVFDAQAQEAEKFNKELFTLQTNVQDVARDLAGPLVKSINEVAKAFRDSRDAGSSYAETALKRYWTLLSPTGLLHVARMGVTSLFDSQTSSASNTGGATGSWDPPEMERPSVVPPPSAAERSAAAAAAAVLKAQQQAYEDLAASIRTKIAVGQLEYQQTDKVTEAQKQGAKLTEDLRSGRVKLTGAQEAVVRSLLAEMDAQEKVNQEAEKAAVIAAARQAERAKETAGINAWIAAQEQAAQASLQSVQQRIASMQDEAQAVGVAANLNISLAEAVERVAIARLEEKQARFNEGSEGYIAVQKEIDARKELAGQIAGKATRDAAAENNKRMLQEWERTVEQYDDVFRDGFADMLNSGKDGWKSFTTSLVTTFKTTVADQIYKMFAQPFVVQIVGQLTGASGLSGAAGGGGGLGGLSNLGSAASNAYSLLGSGSAGGVADLLSASGMGTLDIGGVSLGASASSGVGSAMAAAGPLAALLAFGAVGGEIMKATRGETRYGGRYAIAGENGVTDPGTGYTSTLAGHYAGSDGIANSLKRTLYDARNNILGQGMGQAYETAGSTVAGQAYYVAGPSGQLSIAQDQAMADMLESTSAGINNVLKSIGSAATLSGFWGGFETSDKGRGGVLSGGTLSTGQAFGESGAGSGYDGTLYEKTSTQSPDYQTGVANTITDYKQATLQAVLAAGDAATSIVALIPKSYAEIEALTDEQLDAILGNIDQKIVTVNAFRAAMDQLPFDQLKGLSFDAADGVLALTGGLDALGSKLSSYYQNYYTEEEKLAKATANVASTLGGLGLAMPNLASGAEAARAQFRAYVEAQDLNTEAGRNTLSALLNVQEAFAALTDAADAAAAATEKAAADAVEASNAAAKALQNTWQGISDTLLDQIKRIRGDLADSGAQGFVYAQAQFAIATGQARAGDADAAAALPGLSQTVLELAATNAKSALDLRVLQAQILASLEETNRSAIAQYGLQVPAFASGGVHAGGWALVGEQGPELVNMPRSQIFNASQTGSMLDQSALVDEIKALRAEVAALRVTAQGTERNTKRIDQTTDEWSKKGAPTRNQPGTRLVVEMAP